MNTEKELSTEDTLDDFAPVGLVELTSVVDDMDEAWPASKLAFVAVGNFALQATGWDGTSFAEMVVQGLK